MDAEAMLTETEQLDDEWATHWQDIWRRRMREPNVTMRDVALHTASLQVGQHAGLA